MEKNGHLIQKGPHESGHIAHRDKQHFVQLVQSNEIQILPLRFSMLSFNGTSTTLWVIHAIFLFYISIDYSTTIEAFFSVQFRLSNFIHKALLN